MKNNTIPNASSPILPRQLAVFLTIVAMAIGPAIQTAAANSAAKPAPVTLLVSCLLPGQIKSGPNGVPMIGPRRSVHIPAKDCQLRGGEYIVATVAKPAPVVAPHKAEDLVIVRCLLPDQVRQLGTKATYLKVQRPAHLARWDCRARGGVSATAAQYQQAEKAYIAVVAKNKPAGKQQ